VKFPEVGCHSSESRQQHQGYRTEDFNVNENKLSII